MTLLSRTLPVRRFVGTAVLTALLTAVSTPAFAASPTPGPDSPFSAKAVARAVAPAVESAAPAVRPASTPAAETPAPKTPRQSESFFKSRRGALVLAVFAVGAGYAIYSSREDRIKGINR